jgi:RHS repeat-associated protein
MINKTIYFSAEARLYDGGSVCFLNAPSGGIGYVKSGAGARGYVRAALDHIHSSRAAVGAGENAFVHYSAYGLKRAAGPPRLILRAFTGYEADEESGLYESRRRLYSPSARVFMSIDPGRQGASPYVYCGGDPFNLRDVDGAKFSPALAGLIAALLVVATVAIIAATAGAAAPAAVPAGAASASASGAFGTAAAVIITPTGAVETAVSFGTVAFASTFVGGAVELSVAAGQGEDISPSRALNAMLIQPLISAAGAAMGGAAAGALWNIAPKIVAYAAGALIAGTSTGVLRGVAAGDISTGGRWKSIGVEAGVDVGISLLFFALPTIASGFRRFGRALARPAAPATPPSANAEPAIALQYDSDWQWRGFAQASGRNSMGNSSSNSD